MNTSTPVPFRTQEAILAFALYICGVPEWMPPVNIYDEAILFTGGGGKKDARGNILKSSRYAGLTLEDAARQAFRENVKGHVEYWFERTRELDYFLKTYREQEAEIKAEGGNTDVGVRMRAIMERAAAPDNPMDEREALLRLATIALKTNVAFKNRWKASKPFLRISSPGQVKRTGNTETHPGMKLIPLDASDTIKKDLKL